MKKEWVFMKKDYHRFKKTKKTTQKIFSFQNILVT